MINWNEQAERAHTVAVAKQWHKEKACSTKGDTHPVPAVLNAAYFKAPRRQPEGVDHDKVAAWIALIHSEASEALEALREDSPERRTLQLHYVKDKRGLDKPEGLATEFADIIIRVLDSSAALGLDLHAAFEAKMAYNATREAKHGGKNL